MEQRKVTNAEREQISMAAVGRQFMDLATKNEALRTDLGNLVEAYNDLMKKHAGPSGEAENIKDAIEV